MKNNKIQAFTLAETLIVLAVIGVIAILMVSSLQNATPDKIKTMFKKAYSVTERTVGELVNDENLYPYDEARIGFLNTDAVTIPSTGVVAQGDGKFCSLFSSKLNLIGPMQIEGGNCTFYTSDGIQYWIPNNAHFPKTITVDVNGEENPNRDNGDDRDRFKINILSDGRVNVNGDLESEFLKSASLKK